MGDALTIKVIGGARLKRQLQALEKAASGEMLEIAVIAGAMPILNQAKENLLTNAAVDNRAARLAGRQGTWKSGNLARSLHIGGHADLSELAASTGGDIGGATVKDDFAEVLIGSDVPYSRRIELGFMGKDSLGRTYHQSPQPYLTPAFEERRNEAVKEIGESLEDQLIAAARKTR